MLQTARLEAPESAAERRAAPSHSGTQRRHARSVRVEHSGRLPIARLALGDHRRGPRNESRVSPRAVAAKFERHAPTPGRRAGRDRASSVRTGSLPTSPSRSRGSRRRPQRRPRRRRARPDHRAANADAVERGRSAAAAASAVQAQPHRPLRAAPTLRAVSPPPPAITARSTPKPTPSIIVRTRRRADDRRRHGRAPGALGPPPHHRRLRTVAVLPRGSEPIAAERRLTNPVAVESRTARSSFRAARESA